MFDFLKRYDARDPFAAAPANRNMTPVAPPRFLRPPAPQSHAAGPVGEDDAAQLFGHLVDGPAPAPRKLEARTRTFVNVRKTPSLEGKALGKLAPGIVLDVLAREGAWLKIQHEGGVGYVTAGAKYVQLEEPSAQPVAAQHDAAHDEHLDGESQPAGLAYLSQRDNTFAGTIGSKAGVGADSECNVTTLAMQLVSMGGGVEAVNGRTIELLRQEGVAIKPGDLQAQPEDLLLRLFQARGDAYWKKVAAEHPKFFGKGFYDQWQGNTDSGWHQIAASLRWVAQEYDFVGETRFTDASVAGKQILEKDYFEKTLHPVLEGGGTVMLSTKLTGGHIVMLSGVEADGIRIHDPYGMKLQSGYVKNDSGASTKKNAKLIAEEPGTVSTRLKHNPGLRGHAGNPVDAVGNWGENNFFTWDEVSTWQIGKWNNVAEKRKQG